MPYYTWDAAECSLDNVSEEKFCRAMKGRKGILLVGERVSCANDVTVSLPSAYLNISASFVQVKQRGLTTSKVEEARFNIQTDPNGSTTRFTMSLKHDRLFSVLLFCFYEHPLQLQLMRVRANGDIKNRLDRLRGIVSSRHPPSVRPLRAHEISPP